MFAGAAAEGLENAANAEQAYRKAVEIERDNPLAYQASHGTPIGDSTTTKDMRLSLRNLTITVRQSADLPFVLNKMLS